MPREADPANIERTFVLDALLDGLRVDGRAIDQARLIELHFWRTVWQCNSYFGEDAVFSILPTLPTNLIKIRVYVQISADVTQPLEERKFDGIFNITTELSPIASPVFEAGRQTDQEIMLSRTLEKAIRRSGALDTESLCIISGAKCWSVRADVHVLDADGGLLDACCVAVIAALRHFRRPDVSVQGEVVTIFTLAGKNTGTSQCHALSYQYHIQLLPRRHHQHRGCNFSGGANKRRGVNRSRQSVRGGVLHIEAGWRDRRCSDSTVLHQHCASQSERNGKDVIGQVERR